VLQHAIADFLDRECSRIDTLRTTLSAARLHVEEINRVCVDRCVSDAPTVRLGWVADVRSGITLNGQSATDAEGVPYLRVANVQADRVDLDEVKRIRASDDEIVRHGLRLGDLLMTEGGDIDKLGRGPVWQGQIEPCLHQNHVFAVRVAADRVLPEFAAAATKSSVARAYFERTASRITNIASTNATKVRAMPLPLPTLDDQRERLGILSAHESTLKATTSALDCLDRLLTEYRDALITEAVTGQLDITKVSEAQMDERAHAAAEGDRAAVRSLVTHGGARG
jgi:type I restriction enzyme S subunit